MDTTSAERTSDASDAERPLGLVRATGVGVGAIVGGGILALAGAAFAAAGPAALLAFALNGLLALLTAASFAEMSSAFPESGGAYTFAKKVLSVRAAFMVGWVLWFASVVATVLYAIGFGAYAAAALEKAWLALGRPTPAGWDARRIGLALALAATAYYAWALTRRAGGGGEWATVGKLVVFAVLIGAGAWALRGMSGRALRAQFTPFFPFGARGLAQAMGYTFIAFQGFDLIAAVGGEVRRPQRNIPLAMFLSLGIALAVYLPLLFVVAAASDGSVAEAARRDPETIIALAAQRFMGPAGYWLVLAAGVLAMLSALAANLLAAGHIARAMSRDRTAPRFLRRLNARGAPASAVLAAAAAAGALLLVVPDVSTAGAAASLIFLICFALAHWTSLLTRLRWPGRPGAFRTPWFPAAQVAGMAACAGLAVFQGFAAPAAGVLAALWLAIGAGVYMTLFARQATVADALAEAQDPELVQLRGRSPLVLAPIANPATAASMSAVAHALAPPAVGKVLLLSVVSPPAEWKEREYPESLLSAQAVQREAMAASFAAGVEPEALITVAPEPWPEIVRVSRAHRCESLLLGVGASGDRFMGEPLEDVMNQVRCDVVVLRAPADWSLARVRRVLVPVGGRGDHDTLRARLLGSLCRGGRREVTYLRILPASAPAKALQRAERAMSELACEEMLEGCRLLVTQNNDVAEEIVRRAGDYDLLVLGLPRAGPRRKTFGDIAPRIVRQTHRAVLMISRGV